MRARSKPIDISTQYVYDYISAIEDAPSCVTTNFIESEITDRRNILSDCEMTGRQLRNGPVPSLIRDSGNPRATLATKLEAFHQLPGQHPRDFEYRLAALEEQTIWKTSTIQSPIATEADEITATKMNPETIARRPESDCAKERGTPNTTEIRKKVSLPTTVEEIPTTKIPDTAGIRKIRRISTPRLVLIPRGPSPLSSVIGAISLDT
ncbi:hypothetical protein F4804DRAFT_339584 [Jackrogersella minutella]|nr:hypothetical protein F4804DRAFT_339584 [Jackrogersella minutella]